MVALLAVVALGIGWLIAGRVLRPLRTITATARDISAGNLDQRLAVDGPDDEFRQLGRTLDGLFGRLEASFQAQRHFVANASHELRTPLTAEKTLLQVALADPGATTATLRSACEKALQWNGQQERLIDGLLTLASSERGIEAWEPFDLADTAGKPSWTARRKLSAGPSASTRPWPRPRSPATRPWPGACWPTWSATPSGTTWTAAGSRSPPPSPTAGPS